AIARESAGNPLFVHALAHHTRTAGGDERVAGIAEVLQARMRRLPRPAAALLTAIAVAGRPIRFAAAAAPGALAGNVGAPGGAARRALDPYARCARRGRDRDLSRSHP